MLRKVSLVLFVVVLSLMVAVPTFAQKPDFSEKIYADGVAWGTKGTTTLPAPNGKNDQSFDKLFSFTNGVDEQLPVAEAAPGNPDYNGGRWWAQSVTWNVTPVLLTSYAEIMEHANNGDLSIEDAGSYFQCPLLPVKE